MTTEPAPFGSGGVTAYARAGVYGWPSRSAASDQPPGHLDNITHQDISQKFFLETGMP
jgi:hypothetical protein